MNKELMFSSKSDEWYTPIDFFNELDKEFHFDLDPCATDENHKCDKYFTKESNGLSQKWGGTEFFATRHTGERLVNGLRRLMKNLKRLTL